MGSNRIYADSLITKSNCSLYKIVTHMTKEMAINGNEINLPALLFTNPSIIFVALFPALVFTKIARQLNERIKITNKDANRTGENVPSVGMDDSHTSAVKPSMKDVNATNRILLSML